MTGERLPCPTKRIVISDGRVRTQPHDVVATYRNSIEKNAAKLAGAGFRECSPRVHDLCLLTAGVAFADKAVARWRHVWRRQLTVVVPVYEPDFWKQSHVHTALTALLSALTGDSWAFEFYRRKDGPLQIGQKQLPIKREDLRILPYSHGLDSFALRALELAADGRRSLMLMTSGGEPPGWGEFQSRHGVNRVEHVTLPLHTKLDSKQSRETSYRSRAFVFGVAASILAYFCDSSRVLSAEAGQGSFGPWLDPIGVENPDIRTHPLFSRQLETFIKTVLNHEITVGHPRLWSTKGQTLKELVGLNLHDGWETTLSCAGRRKYTTLDHKRVNCGVCPACILRRTSLHAAGLDHNSESHLWSDLSAASLPASAHPMAREYVDDDDLHAWAAVAAMERFASHASTNLKQTRPVHLFELGEACAVSTDDVSGRLDVLTTAHNGEWLQFCNSLGQNSFINSYRIRLQARRQ